MRQHIHWKKLKSDSVNGYGIQVTYTFTSFDAKEVEDMEKFCKEFIKDGIIADGVRAYSIDEYRNKYPEKVEEARE